MALETIQDLHAHLRLAIQIELATIPAYLYAMYSIEDQNAESALLVRSIVAEEMLHAALVSNVLLAVGGHPDFRNPDLVPRYPMLLPHHTPPLELGLYPISEDLIRDVFMAIEQPETHEVSIDPDRFETLGQFYHTLENGLSELQRDVDLFGNPQASSQLSNPAHYAPVQFDADDSGGLLLVHDLDSAFEALEIIVHQGEGVSSERWADPEHRELTHYHKLVRIAEGTSPLSQVRAVPVNPKTTDFPESLQPVSEFFNAAYRYLFHILGDLFAPSADKGPMVGMMYSFMNTVMSETALYLVHQDLRDGMFAAPTFEFRPFETADPDLEFVAIARKAADLHPELSGVAAQVETMMSGQAGR